MSAPATKAPATPPLRVLTFESDRPPRPRRTDLADLPSVARKALRLAALSPAEAEVIEGIIDRLLSTPIA